ncbi:hypothetical protein FHW58_003468 [Duganella sp. 1224]|uniref:alpha/beta fold hydrolase n=1 Tax=Duganella sp. 1224 TaxID=2587052 RepID=UPI0015CA0381|nr:hypothetical protein [Duganella sp. 1224]NYE62253.1 hypothetical protein [Duganella sp. 1224]
MLTSLRVFACICSLLVHATSGAQAGAPRGAYISPLLPGHHRLALHGVPAHYEVMGDGPLLLVPAPRDDLAELSRHFTLVVCDLPASAAGADKADHLDALRRYLKREKVDLLGDAQGTASAYASRYPDRVRRLMPYRADASAERIVQFFSTPE